MKNKIVYDKPGRIRFRMGQSAFTADQGYGIEELMLLNPLVVSAEASHVNGGLLVHYIDGGRDAVISAVRALNSRQLPVSQKKDVNLIRELDDTFSRSVAVALLRHYALKLFVPAPIRMIIALRRAFFIGKRVWVHYSAENSASMF